MNTIEILVNNKVITLDKLNAEKKILLNTLKTLMDLNLPYSTITDRIQAINNTLVIVREMPN